MNIIPSFLRSFATGLAAKHRATELDTKVKKRLTILDPAEMMIYGSTEWIRAYLTEKSIPFMLDHVMGEPYCHVKMTRADFDLMCKEAKMRNDDTCVSLM